MTEQQAVSAATLKAITEAFNAHDLDAIMEFFADDCSFDMPRGPEWLLTGTARDGRRVRVRGCDHWEFRNGKVTRKDSYWEIVEPARGVE